MKHLFEKGNKVNLGRTPWNKGLKGIHLSPDTEFKRGRRDDKHPEWKGEFASYSAVHHWVKRWKGKPIKCEHCGKKKECQWANIDHNYRRNLDDFISLCVKCHSTYDKEFNGKFKIKEKITW